LGAEHALGFLEADSRAWLADVDEQEAADDAGARRRVQGCRAARDPPPLTRQAGEIRGLRADVDRRDQAAIARDRARRVEGGRAGEYPRGVLRGRLDCGGQQGDRESTGRVDATTSPCDV
jgi:hypothetical protein